MSDKFKGIVGAKALDRVTGYVVELVDPLYDLMSVKVGVEGSG